MADNVRVAGELKPPFFEVLPELHPPVTGKIHVRRVGDSPARSETHELISVVAVLSVPKGSFRDDGMYVVAGTESLLTLTDAGETQDSRGRTHGSMMCEPIWQC